MGAALAFGPIFVQRFTHGAPVSVTLLAARGRACALCLNAQNVTLGAVSAYRGGVTGSDHPRRDEVFRVAREAAALVPGLHGLVGVDLVAGDDACEVLEINARVTTPVLGLRRALALDLAAAWWTACVDGVLPVGPVRVRRPVPFAAEGADES